MREEAQQEKAREEALQCPIMAPFPYRMPQRMPRPGPGPVPFMLFIPSFCLPMPPPPMGPWNMAPVRFPPTFNQEPRMKNLESEHALAIERLEKSGATPAIVHLEQMKCQAAQKDKERKKMALRKFSDKLSNCLSGKEVLAQFEERDRKKLEEIEWKEENKKKCELAREQRIQAEAERQAAQAERKCQSEEAKKKKEEEWKEAAKKWEDERIQKWWQNEIEKLQKKYGKYIAKRKRLGLTNASAYDLNVQVSDKAFTTEDSSDEDAAPQQKEGECFKCRQEEYEPMVACEDCGRLFHEHCLPHYLLDENIDKERLPFS